MTSTRFLLFAVAITIAVPLSTAQALMLDTWNYDDLQASGDYVDLQFGTFDGNTTLTLQWIGGANDIPDSIGVDMLYINNRDTALEVVNVYVNSIVAANDVTGDWMPTNGGTQAGGGFGIFVERTAEPGGDGGIAPNSLIFVLNGLYSEASFIANADGASFAIHARDGACSGWAANGGTPGSSGSNSGCSGAPVPEPSAALAFAAGALIVGSTLRRRR